MKRIAAIILVLVTSHAYGQFAKGDKVLGGTLSLNANSVPGTSSGLINDYTSFSIVPNFGFFLNESMVLGLAVGYSSTEYKYSISPPVVDNFGSRDVITGVYLQKYYPISDKFFFSLNGGISYTFGKTFDKTTNSSNGSVTESTQNENMVAVGIGPGFNFFPSQRWSFNANIGRIQYTHKTTGSQSENKWEASYGTVSIGLSYYFRKG